MKRYKFEIIVEEENDEFWEELNNSGYSKCDDIHKVLEDNLDPIVSSIKLIEYTDA